MSRSVPQPAFRPLYRLALALVLGAVITACTAPLAQAQTAPLAAPEPDPETAPEPGPPRPLRIASFHADLSRDGPGLLLRDILSGRDPQIEAAAQLIARADPDAIVLTGIDWDLEGRALAAFRDRLRAAGGQGYAHLLALEPNAGRLPAIERDQDGDGRLRGGADALGWGRFTGEGGLAVIARVPILRDQVLDLSGLLWRDLPGALIGPDEAGLADQLRLSSTGHWVVPLLWPGLDRPLNLMAFAATPPVFDGPEDRNGRRNHDEAALWLRLLDGALPWPAPAPPYVILGNANLDPVDGDGRGAALLQLLGDARLQDPAPRSPGGAAAAALQGGVNASQRGDPALDTADWRDGPGGPGNLRVDYILPWSGLRVVQAQVLWPSPGGAGDDDDLADLVARASRHRMVLVTLGPP